MINLEDELKNCFSLIEPKTQIQSEFQEHASRQTAVDYRIVIPKELSFFHGHFPNSPVLPAVGMIDITQFLLTQFYKPKTLSFPEISKVKIKSPVLPNTPIDIKFEISELEVVGSNLENSVKVECSWFCNQDHAQDSRQNQETTQILVAQLYFKMGIVSP